MLGRVRVLSHLEASRCGELALRGEEPRDMFSHIFLGVADFERALSFYRALMPVLGIRERFCERERPWAGWQSEPGPRPLFLIGVPYDGQPHEAGNGQMVAFVAQSRAVVDRPLRWRWRMVARRRARLA